MSQNPNIPLQKLDRTLLKLKQNTPRMSSCFVVRDGRRGKTKRSNSVPNRVSTKLPLKKKIRTDGEVQNGKSLDPFPPKITQEKKIGMDVKVGNDKTFPHRQREFTQKELKEIYGKRTERKMKATFEFKDSESSDEEEGVTLREETKTNGFKMYKEALKLNLTNLKDCSVFIIIMLLLFFFGTTFSLKYMIPENSD